MANVGRASAGPSIASSRGGPPLGIRVGGIEGGRSVRLSTADLRINNIFGPAISSPQQIGFRPQQPMGFESVRMRDPKQGPRIFGETQVDKPKVRFLGNLPNRVPERGADLAQPRVVTKSVRFSEPVARPALVPTEPKPRTIQFPETKVKLPDVSANKNSPSNRSEIRTDFQIQKSPEAAKTGVSVDKHIFAQRVKEVLARLTAKRTQTLPAVFPEASNLVEPNIRTKLGPITEAHFRTGVNTKQEVKTEAGIPSAVAPEKVTKNQEPSRSIARRERRNRRFLKVDEKTNSLRLSALRDALRSLRELNQDNDISGSDVVKSAEIFAKRFRSNLLMQLGLENREDGSAYALARDLSSNQSLTEEKLDTAVEANNAVEKSTKPVGIPATIDETQKVLTPPKTPPEKIPEVLIRDQVEIIDVYRSGSSESDLVPGPHISGAEPIEFKIPEVGIIDEPIDFITHPLVKKVLCVTGVNNGIEAKRRQLLLAV